ncbi:hypothetical protein B0A48_18163 [Cryoendolithus antarcticus]|uniref:DUF6590 domain-containing protein n=1 Tax=Cryoendolithus antarcticus TaxID=1507870 RepID=A0A1V8S9J2_9PEZI|nr:hypothetical protein B0A48_18163 [Cryoendolithus antarcticus]
MDIDIDIDPWLERSLLEIRLKLARYIRELQRTHDDFGRKMLDGWIFHMALLDQFRTAVLALQSSSTNGPGVFLAAIVAHIDDLIDIHADDSDIGTGDAVVEPPERLGSDAFHKDLTDSLAAVDLSAQYSEESRVDAHPRSGQLTTLRSHDIVVRLLFDTLRQASKLTDRKIWLCPLHADAAHCSSRELQEHLMDGTHGISEEQAKILVTHAVTRPMSENDNAWEPNCDAGLIDARGSGQVMNGVAAIVVDFCLAADTVQQAILLRSREDRSEGKNDRLVELRQLHELLTQASLQCRQHCHNGQKQLGVAFEVGDDIAFQDLYNVHRGLSRQFEDIATLSPGGIMSLTHHRNMCSVTQSGHYEAVQAIIQLMARVSAAAAPEPLPSTTVDTAGPLHAWLSSVRQHDPAGSRRNAAPVQPAGNHGTQSRRGGQTKSVASSASTVFSEPFVGVSSATSVTSADPISLVSGADRSRSVMTIPGYRSQGKGTMFFSPGRVFEMVQTEIAGYPARASGLTGRNVSVDVFGQPLISKRRALISVHADATSCRAVPITSYNGQGVSKFGVVKAYHCIVHTSKVPPDPLAVEAPDVARQEEPMQPYAIRIDADPAAGWMLHETSRLNLGDEQRVEHYTGVKNLGRVNRASMPYLELQLRRVRELRYPHPTKDFGVEEALLILSRMGLPYRAVQQQLATLRN